MSKMVADPVLSLVGRRRAEMLAVGRKEGVHVEQVRSERRIAAVMLSKGLGTCTATDDDLSGSASQASFAACEEVF